MPPWRKYSASRGVVDAHARVEAHRLPPVALGAHVHLGGRRAAAGHPPGEARYREHLLAGQPERLRALAVRELQRQHAHADEVGAMDALEALRDHRPDAEEARALGGPVARGSGPVLAACQHDQVDALGDVAHGGVVDRHLLGVGIVTGQVAGCSRLRAAARVPPPMRLRRRMLANVPRIITSWLPRREP